MRRREFLSKSFTMGFALPAVGSLLQASSSPGRKPRSRSAGKVLSEPELEDIVRGCSYLSCGGGGTLRGGLEIVRRDLARLETLDRNVVVFIAEVPRTKQFQPFRSAPEAGCAEPDHHHLHPPLELGIGDCLS